LIIGGACDASDDIYVTGFLQSTNATFGRWRLSNLQTNGHDFFLAKYDGTGKVLWAKAIRAAQNPQAAWGVGSDAAGNCYAMGDFRGIGNLGDGVTVTNSSWDGTLHTFLVKFDAAGRTLWAHEAASGAWNTPRRIIVDARGNCYLAGAFNGYSIQFGRSVLMGLQTNEIFAAEFDSDGKPLWANRFGSGLDEYPQNMAVDRQGSCYLVVTWMSTVLAENGHVFPDGVVDHRLYSHPKNNDVILKYAPDGSVVWTKYLKEVNPGNLSTIAPDNFGNLHLAGTFWKDNSCVLKLDSLAVTNTDMSGSEVFVAEIGSNMPLSELSGNQRHSCPANPLKLQAIFLGSKPSALVGGRSIEIGDKLEEYTVASIAAETVTLRTIGGATKVLAVGDDRVTR